MQITDLEPKRLWKQFHDICQVPRPSKKEAKMIAFLQHFGAEHGLDTQTDAAGNVLIRKAATPGYEQKPTIVLQSHMDMVCEKNSDTVHNFDTDPIQPWIDGDWVRARGTTLGGDDGIGCATELAILASNDLKHPALECLFTVDEETGLTGAFALDANLLKGQLLINLDSEDDGQFFIGCAGGIDTTVTFDYKPETMPAGLYYFEIKVNGLKGGHSGGDIHLGRGNANKVLNRFMWRLMTNTDLRVAEVNGGNLRNAIAREARAVCAVPEQYRDTLASELNQYQAEISRELSVADPDVHIEINTVAQPATMIDCCTAKRLIQALYACPHGVIRMSDELEGIVETSTNLAAVKMQPDNQILVTTSQRSLTDSAKRDIATQVEAVFTLAGAKATHGDGYPGWKPNPHSKIANALADTYKKLFNREPQILAIHAGLECGLFLEKYPQLDMVSVGPTMIGVHSPDEKLNIPAVQDFWKMIVYVLENI